MKIAHWTAHTTSGMNRVAESIQRAELSIGLDSFLCDVRPDAAASAYDEVLDADIHVAHTHFPDWFARRLKRKYKLVTVCHGTPENIFMLSVESGKIRHHGCSDGLMLMQHALKVSDAVVTFWPRHADIWRTMVPKTQTIHCIPLGVDKTFWSPGEKTNGLYGGRPSLIHAENCHTIKWPLDLITAWPWVYNNVANLAPSLHVVYLPQDLHRWFFPFANANGAAYASHMSATVLSHEDLRTAFRSVDYQIGLVRYGDFNRVSLEANACGCKTISFNGNPYADFWIPEGDQRIIADALVSILNGTTPPRKKTVVPDISETVSALREIYNSF
jgi:hypothetical protein